MSELKIEHNVPLAPHTTMKLGGSAKYFLTVTSAEQVPLALRWASEQGCAWRVLGAGSNTLISDHGYDGLVMLMKNDVCTWDEEGCVAEAGLTNGQLIAQALHHHRGGLQWLVGVPGTVGGSLYGNAGGHGWGLGDMVDWVNWVDDQGHSHRWSKAECNFAYRTSGFKHTPGVITGARLVLPKVEPSEERQRLVDVTKTKNTNQPTTAQSAGCMFMNPTVEPDRLPADLRPYVDDRQTISAWRLIVATGLQGKQIGRIQISSKHANFMINLGGGTADQVVQLLSFVKQQVRDTLGVQLHEEVQYLGF